LGMNGGAQNRGAGTSLTIQKMTQQLAMNGKNDQKKQPCPICGKMISQLPAHLKTHSQERKFQCPKCPAKFKRAQTLKQHLPIHSSEPQFKCTLCPATFRQSPNFYLHMKHVHNRGRKDVKKDNRSSTSTSPKSSTTTPPPNQSPLAMYSNDMGLSFSSNAIDSILGTSSALAIETDEENQGYGN